MANSVSIDINNPNNLNAPLAVPPVAAPSKWKKIAGIIGVIAAVIIAYAVFPMNATIVGCAFLIGFLCHKQIYPLLKKELVDPLCKHPIIAITATVVAGLLAPHFVLLAVSTLYCGYFGSWIKHESQPQERVIHL